MSVRKLIDAIESGDSLSIEENFELEVSKRISARLDEMKKEVAKNMFEGCGKKKEEDITQEDILEFIETPEFDELDEDAQAELLEQVKDLI